MNKLSKEKRSQLALVTIVILLIATGLYMGLVRGLQRKVQLLDLEKDKANRKLERISDISHQGGEIAADLAAVRSELEARESEMVSDDLYSSMINKIRKFKLAYPVEIKQFTSKGASDMNMIPRFPYKQFTVSILGSAYYHDLGKFIADFENEFRSSRIANIELTAESAQTPDEKEKLIFRMEIISLVKNSAPAPNKKP